MTTATAPATIRAAFEFAIHASSFAVDYDDRAGERRSATFSGSDAYARAERGVRTLRSQCATRIVVTGYFATGEEIATLADNVD